MSHAIIGFGEIGQALAKAFDRNGIEVSVAIMARGASGSGWHSSGEDDAPVVWESVWRRKR